MILITGASSGIGEACARVFAREKRNLFLVARREDRLKQLADGLSKEYGVQVHTARLDVSDKKAVASLAEEKKALFAQVSVLVNNAGLALGIDSLQDGKADDWDVMIDTNVKGLLYVTRAVLPHFLKNGGGHIVNLGSVASRWAYPKGNVYCATKRAVSALNETMRLDLQGSNIRVTEISPGLVETEFSLVRLKDKEKAKAVYAGIHALTPHDIADAIAWCVSRPAHVNVQEMVLYPTNQASPQHVLRK